MLFSQNKLILALTQMELQTSASFENFLRHFFIAVNSKYSYILVPIYQIHVRVGVVVEIAKGPTDISHDRSDLSHHFGKKSSQLALTLKTLYRMFQ